MSPDRDVSASPGLPPAHHETKSKVFVASGSMRPLGVPRNITVALGPTVVADADELAAYLPAGITSGPGPGRVRVPTPMPV